MKIKSVTGTNVELELTSKSTSTPPQKIKSSGSNGQWESYSERAAIQRAQEQQKLNKQHKAKSNQQAQAEFKKAQKSKTKKESQTRQPKSSKQNSSAGEDPNANGFLFPNLGIGVPEIVLDFKTTQKK